MPATVLVEGMLKAIAVAFGEELEDVATCFVPDWIVCCYPLYAISCFYRIINMIVVIQISRLNQVFTDKESIITNATSKVSSVV